MGVELSKRKENESPKFSFVGNSAAFIEFYLKPVDYLTS